MMNELSENRLKVYNKTLNYVLSKKYDWFYRIDIEEVPVSSKYGSIFFNNIGKIYVDDIWAYQQWREYHYSTPFPGYFEGMDISFGDFIGSKESTEIQKYFKDAFTFVTDGLIGKYTSFSWLQIEFVEQESNEEQLKEELEKSYVYSEKIKNILQESRKEYFLKSRFDKLFNSLTIEKTDPDLVMYNWTDVNNKLVFQRNHWGTLWVYDCDIFDDIELFGKLLDIDLHDNLMMLVSYLNRRYKEEFEDRPLRSISYEEDCDDY